MPGKIKRCLFIFVLIGILLAGQNQENELEFKTWGERLGFPKDKRVLILHADDVGLCREANQAAQHYFSANQIQSASVMMPCPQAEAFLKWYQANPGRDIGLHITLTSEWKTYRWGTVSPAEAVPGLLDPDGKMWRDVPNVVRHATPEEINQEIRAQIEKFLAQGVRPGHLDTHMGTVYATVDFAKVYLQIAMEYGIPAMAIEFTPPVVEHFRGEGYPITDEMIKFAASYTLPKLDDFRSVASAKTYADKKQKFFELVRSLRPGITEIIFHPSVESDSLKQITNSWQQRVWEAQMFSDPEVLEFLAEEGVLFTNWKEMMARFKAE